MPASQPSPPGAPASSRATTPPVLRSRIHWAYVVALAATIVTASGQSNVASPVGFINFDKLAHFCIFGLLASLVVRSPGRARAWSVTAIALVSAFGISDEFHQSFTPGRSVEFDDWIADTLGAILAVSLYVNWTGYRRLMERRLPSPLRRQNPARATVRNAGLAAHADAASSSSSAQTS